MKTLISISLVAMAVSASAQSIVGKWQLSEQKTCFQSNMATEMKESDTEKELSSSMGSTSSTSVARIMTLEDDGKGEDGVFSAGKKKATSKTPFRYQVADDGFYILDKKSGVITQRWVIDELTETTLKIHDAAKECEIKTYIKASF